MKPISHSLRDMLVRQGIANAKPVGAGKVRGMGAGMLEGTAHPLAAQAGENREPMGMSKMDELYKPYRTYVERAGAAKAPASQQEVGKRQVKLGRSGDSFLWLIADNVDVVPTDRRTTNVRRPVFTVVK